MFKNQLQELAQRSCFNLPSYACIREGPDHAPRFKASVNFNGEIFDSPTYSSTLRQAEHAAAEVALNSLSARGPSRSLTARVLDETGVYKNLLQETAHRAGLKLPSYTTVRSGPGHVPVFTSTVELASMKFTGESAKTKKQAEKNAAIAAWSALKKMVSLEQQQREDQDHVTVRKVLSSLGPRDESRVNIISHLHHDYKLRGRNMQQRVPPHRYRDQNNPNSSSSSSQTKQWKLLDHYKDSSPEIDSKTQKNSFLALLPPPPQRTTSRIFPPQMKVQGVNSLEVEVQKPNQVSDGSSIASSNLHKGKAICNPISFNFPMAADRIHSFKFVPQMSTPQFNFSSTCASQMGRWSTSSNDSQRTAPSVQIRSVIPVCAAPPLSQQRMSSFPNPKSMLEETDIPQSTSSSSSTEAATTKMSKLNL